MTWEIVTGLVVLVSLIATFVGAAWKVANILGTLNATIIELKQALAEFRDDSKQTHADVYNQLHDHDRRITSLEVTAHNK